MSLNNWSPTTVRERLGISEAVPLEWSEVDEKWVVYPGNGVALRAPVFISIAILESLENTRFLRRNVLRNLL